MVLQCWVRCRRCGLKAAFTSPAEARSHFRYHDPPKETRHRLSCVAAASELEWWPDPVAAVLTPHANVWDDPVYRRVLADNMRATTEGEQWTQPPQTA